jgi:release factor glutamine methyltransferase
VTLADHASGAAQVLEVAGLAPEDARAEAALLARWVLGWSQTEWLCHSRDLPPTDFADQFQAATRRRANREPVSYITGTREFYGRSFRVTPDVLVPRPETELVVEEALESLAAKAAKERGGDRPPVFVADVGTGSGCLAITIALESPSAKVLAIDISDAILTVAHENARALGADDRIEFWRGTCLPGGMRPLDLIVANPPYVAERDRESLPIEVRGFEPAEALFGGPDGLHVIRALVPGAAAALGPAGSLVMEIGAGQSEEVARCIESTGRLTVHHIRPDLQGIPRVVVARKK